MCGCTRSACCWANRRRICRTSSLADTPAAAALPAPPAIPAGLPADLLRRRPDIRAAERQLAAATANIGVAVADYYPDITLTASPALVSTALSNLLTWGSRNLTAGPGLSWTLFDGGKVNANVAIANEHQHQALLAYRKTVLTALQEVEDALTQCDADRTRQQDAGAPDRQRARRRPICRARNTVPGWCRSPPY